MGKPDRLRSNRREHKLQSQGREDRIQTRETRVPVARDQTIETFAIEVAQFRRARHTALGFDYISKAEQKNVGTFFVASREIFRGLFGIRQLLIQNLFVT